MKKTKTITTCGLLTAIAFISMLICRIHLVPAASFLSYDPKDAIIAITGFIFGPLYALAITLIVSFLEMITVSGTGPIGMLMNILSTASFALPAAIVYRKIHSRKGAIISLLVGVISMSSIMLLWNYLITPIYQGVPRETVAAMLVPVFLPFELLKSLINMSLTLIIYKPIVTALRRAGLVEDGSPRKDTETGSGGGSSASNSKMQLAPWIIGLIILIVCIAVVAFLKLG